MKVGACEPVLIALCERHREIKARQEQLHNMLADLEAMLVDRHGWFELTRIQRRALPAAQSFYDLEDELEQLGGESAQAVRDLVDIRASSLDGAVAKLEVIARVVDPDDYPDAHAVLSGAINELRILSRQY